MRSGKTWYLEVVLFFAVLVLGLNLNILDNGATNWDDPALFDRPVLRSVTAENLKSVVAIAPLSTYQPVRDLTYMLDFALWGPGQKAVIFGMHLQSLVLYLLTVLACWLFLLELFRIFEDDPSRAFLWSVLSCTLYAVHPVHVESVAWLYARKEPLLGVFVFLSLWTFIRGRVASWWYYLPSLLFLVLAILSKPIALVAPAVMLVLDLAIQARRPDASYWKKRLFVFVPMLLLVIPMAVRLVVMMHDAGGIKPYHGGSFWNNLFAVSQIFMGYISLIGFTINYAADYPLRLYASPHAWQAWLYVALNIALAGSACVAWWKKHYLYAFFIAWFYVFLLPVSHLFPISQDLADRYALLPSLTWCVLLGYLFMKLWVWRPVSSRFTPEFPTLVAVAVFAMLTLGYGFMTFHQNDVWTDAQTLWEDTLAKYPNSSPGNVNLAAIYLHQGRYSDVQKLCLTAIRQKPYDYLAMSNLSLAQMMMGQYDNAINNYKQALKINPSLAKAKMGLAEAYWFKKDYAKAYEAYSGLFKQGIIDVRDPRLAQYFYAMGFSAWKIGKNDEAEKYLARAMALSPKRPLILDDLGAAYTSMGDYVRARQAFERFYPMLGDEKSRQSLTRLLQALDKKISRQSGQSSAPQAKP